MRYKFFRTKTVLPALLLIMLVMTFSGCTSVETPQPAPPISIPEEQKPLADVTIQPPVITVPESPDVASPDSAPQESSEIPNTTNGQATIPPASEPTLPTPETHFISTETAKLIAIESVKPGAKIVSFEEELDDSPPIYKIELEHGNDLYELEIHAVTGAVIDFEREEKEHSEQTTRLTINLDKRAGISKKH